MKQSETLLGRVLAKALLIPKQPSLLDLFCREAQQQPIHLDMVYAYALLLTGVLSTAATPAMQEFFEPNAEFLSPRVKLLTSLINDSFTSDVSAFFAVMPEPRSEWSVQHFVVDHAARVLYDTTIPDWVRLLAQEVYLYITAQK